MEAAQTSAPSSTPVAEDQAAPKVPSQDVHLRRCLVSGEMLPKAELLRFVVGPDQTLYADLEQNLPGRGLWVSATREAVTTAAKKNLFAKAAKTGVKIAPDLIDQIEQLLRKRCLNFLGLARRSGISVPGQLQVEQALKAGELTLLFLSDDASSDLGAYRATRNVKTSNLFNRKELGAALGQEQLAYVGLKVHALTEKLLSTLEQLEKIGQPGHITSGKI